jgi:hypothetical protein
LTYKFIKVKVNGSKPFLSCASLLSTKLLKSKYICAPDRNEVEKFSLLLCFGKNDGDCHSLFSNLETDFAKQEQKTTTTTSTATTNELHISFAPAGTHLSICSS